MKYVIVHPNKIPAPGIEPGTVTMHYVEHNSAPYGMQSDASLKNATRFDTHSEAEAVVGELRKDPMNRDLVFTIMRVE